MTNFFIQ